MIDHYKHIDKKDYRWSLNDEIPLFPNWDTEIDYPSETEQCIKYSCYIRWEDFDGTMRQELKSLDFVLNNKRFKSENDKIVEDKLKDFIKDCYISILTNCEKYRNEKFMNVDKYQTSEKNHFLEIYEVKEVIDALCYKNFKFTIDEQ